MLAEVKELWKYRELLVSMVERELRIRYKNSVLGFFWSLINPLVTVLVLTFVFKNLNGDRTDNFSAYVLAGYLPYMFFQFAILDSAQSILIALPLVRKIYFPREILPLSVIISNFIHFLLALVVFFAYLLVIWLMHPGQSPFQWTALLLPFLLVVNLALATGFGLLISALNTFYEDVKYIVSVALYLLFFLCPIFYFSERVYYGKATSGTNWIYIFYHLNPVAMLCTAYRKILLAPQPVDIIGADRVTHTYPALPLDLALSLVAATISFLMLWIGYTVFNRMKWKFVERP